MRILVAYASRYGATRGIAERIAKTLRDLGHQAAALPIRNVGETDGYDAYVIGSAAYMFRWMPEATNFVRREAAVLRRKQVWLFTSGPIGTDKLDAEGRDVLETSAPKEIAELSALVSAREHRVFFGAFDHVKLSGLHRVVYAMPAMKKLLVDGDYRDWPLIESWAHEISAALEPAEILSL